MSYATFLEQKSQMANEHGFAPIASPDFLFDFQHALVDWAVRKGRAAIFADCGLGKTPMQLVWAENVLRKTNRPVLIATPLAVSHQTIAEGEKFGIGVRRSQDGAARPGITVTNYERLHHFNPDDFGAFVGDESSILKSFDGQRRAVVTEFMRKIPFRLLCTATAAPNDYIELGTSSEALGQLGYMDMLHRFFKNDLNNSATGRGYLGSANKWRFKGHAETPFWQWVCSWGRAIRRPSDLGFDDRNFVLPPLIEREHVVATKTLAPGMLFALPAEDLKEQREERRRTIKERCEEIAALVSHPEQALIWCHLNDEGNLLEEIIKDAEQVSGEDTDEAKEEKFLGFARGQISKLVTKPKIGAWGLNFQNCAHVTTFPSHSFEQYYQAVRRCWRFGQKKPVRVDIVTTDGERGVMENLQRKAKQADRMFESLVAEMNRAIEIGRTQEFTQAQEVPACLLATR
jgi:hypothetical protein